MGMLQLELSRNDIRNDFFFLISFPACPSLVWLELKPE